MICCFLIYFSFLNQNQSKNHQSTDGAVKYALTPGCQTLATERLVVMRSLISLFLKLDFRVVYQVITHLQTIIPHILCVILIVTTIANNYDVSANNYLIEVPKGEAKL